MNMEKTQEEKQTERWDFLSRKGRFSISLNTITNYPLEVMELLSQVLIREARYLWDSNQVEYSGCSKLFRQVGEGLRGNEYNLIHDEDGLRFL